MKKIILFLALFLVWYSNTILAQERVTDSLLSVVKTAKLDTNKIIAYEQLALVFRKSNKDSSFYFNQKAIDLAKSINNTKFIAESYREYALTAQANDDYDLAITYYKKVLEVFENINNKAGVGESYNDIGVANYYAGNYDTAREYFEKAGNVRIEIRDSIGAAQSFNNSGIMYDIAGNPTAALKLYLKSLNIYENARDTANMIGTISNIGLIYSGQKNFKEAIKVYQQQRKLAQMINDKKMIGVALNSEGAALDELGKYLDSRKLFYEALDIFIKLSEKALIANCYNNLSVNFGLTNELDKALEYGLKSIKLKEELGNLAKLSVAQIATADVYSRMGQYPKAIGLFTEALKNAEETQYIDYITLAHKGLSQAYFQTKNYQKAYYHQSLYVSYKDSVANEANSKLISELEKKFQSERKQQEIELLNKTNALKDVELEKASEESKRKSLQLYGLLIVGIILLGFASVVYRNNQQRKRTNELLSQKNHEITIQKEIVEEQHREIKDSIIYAKRIQDAILPSKNILKETIKNGFVLFKPKDIVSGDFYWLEKFVNRDGKQALFLAAADCTGHGVPGAMVSVMCSNALSKAVLEENITEPGKLLDRTRELILERFNKSDEDVKDGMDISVVNFPLTIEKAGKILLQYAGANNPLWIIKQNTDSTSEFIEIKADKQPIGKLDNAKPFTSHTIELNSGDCFYLFTDGMPDQFGGPKGKKFMYKKLKELLVSISKEEMSVQHLLISEAFDNWKGNLEQVDDITLIGVRI